ncbi:MAG TPA: hypothetical protein VEY07_08905, partial [Thermoplasmata archaeon]|nr:hypothetical protein [Thermoplasmata archaeon]
METTTGLDILVLAVANAANLLMVGIFVARGLNRPRLARLGFGIPLLFLGIPLTAASLWSLVLARPSWAVLLPLPLVGFLVLEWLLDYVLKLDFRHTRIVGPYLGLYYVAFMLMVGYTFVALPAWGFATLATY